MVGDTVLVYGSSREVVSSLVVHSQPRLGADQVRTQVCDRRHHVVILASQVVGLTSKYCCDACNHCR